MKTEKIWNVLLDNDDVVITLTQASNRLQYILKVPLNLLQQNDSKTFVLDIKSGRLDIELPELELKFQVQMALDSMNRILLRPAV